MSARPDTTIDTYTGKVVDFDSPDQAQIELGDIAWGLSRTCRFGAQSLDFYSVAQHAVTVALAVELMGRSDLALAALHHDSHEAYTCDLPGPLKVLLEGYRDVTDRLDTAIAEALGFAVPEGADKAPIKDVDNAVFSIEAAELLRTGPGGASPVTSPEAAAAARAVIETPLRSWGFELAESKFTQEHGRLADRA